MHGWVTGVVVAYGVLTTLVLLVLLARDVLAEDRTFALVVGYEVVVLVEVVVGFVSLARTSRDVSAILFSSYLVGTLVALPIGAVWSLGEKGRARAGVLLAAVLVLLFLQLRLTSIWSGNA